jgi:EmrB/QacA subfamily drug resistance transporter
MRQVNRWAVLIVLSAALAIISLDNTIVNVALPRLQEDLGASTAQLQWVVDAYSVMFAGSLLLAGSLGDRFGRRKMLLVGLVIFTTGSLMAVFVNQATMLTLCRAFMGVGGAFIMPSTLSILVQVFKEPKERAQAIGTWAAVAGLGVAIGPIVGGLLLEHFTWHAIFWVNPPIAIVVMLAVLRYVPESADQSKPRLDLIGALLSGLGLVALIVTIIELPEVGIEAFTIGAALGAVVFLVGFVLWEKRAPRPLLPMKYFKERLFSTSIVIVALVYFALMGAMFFLPQFLQLVKGMSPLQSGIAVLPGAGGLLLASLVSPKLADRFGTRRLVVAGMSIVTAGMLALSYLQTDTPYLSIAIVFGSIGAGLGLTLPQATNGVLASVPTERAGMGSAVNDAMSELGGSFGVAILGATMSIFYRQHIEQAIANAGDKISLLPTQAVAAARESLAAASIEAARIPDSLGKIYRDVAGQAFVTGMTWALFIGAVITFAGVLIAWRFLPQHVERIDE